jgi:uncharacterized protein
VKEPSTYYYKYSDFLKQKFGCPVRKITLDAGFDCPNRDGTLSTEGCIFCDNHAFSPALALRHLPVKDQVLHWIGKLKKKESGEKYLAYFQSFTNTHKPSKELKRIYDQALCHEDVVGIAIGTRPDSVNEEKMDVIAALKEKCYVSLELGVQSMHKTSLEWMNRRHGFDAVVKAAKMCRERGIDLCFHVILGLPGENRKAVQETAKALADLDYQSIKIHHLHVSRATKLESLFYSGKIRLPEMKEHAEMVVDFLELTPATITVQRLIGDASVDFLVAPEWGLDKQAVLREIDREFDRRKSRQGSLISF